MSNSPTYSGATDWQCERSTTRASTIVESNCRLIPWATRRLNAEFEREGWPAYRTRIGLHSGEAVVGNIGSEDRMNYTTLGATVNLAASYGTSILVSSALKQRAGLRFCFRSIDRIRPKGFAEAFEIYELRYEHAQPDANELEFCRAWEIVYAALRERPTTLAEVELGAFLAKYPHDSVACYHRQSARPS